MGVDASIPFEAGKAANFNLADIMQNAQLMRMRDQQMKIDQQTANQQQAEFGRKQTEWNKADDTEARNQAAVKLASGGDYAGADSQYGAGAGNLDTHQLIAGLHDQARATAHARLLSAAGVVIQARQAPDPATRAQMIQGASQELIANGWKPEEIAGFIADPKNLTDAGLDGFLSSLRQGDEALKAYDAQQAKLNEPYTLGVDQRRFVGDKQIAQGPPSFHSVTTPEGSISTVWGAPGSPGGSTAAAGGKLDPAQFFKEFVAPHEGGFAAHDANGAPVNFGINQSANPGVNVRTMTKDQAAQIFTNKYFAASGAADLPPALAAVVADTAYINPARAKQFLTQSGGDPAKFMALREGWMANLVQSDPQKYGKYEKAWNNRNRDLAAYSANLAGGGQAPTGGGPITIHGAPKPEGAGAAPPKGYRWKPDGTMEPVPGGPADPGNVDIPGPRDLAKRNAAYPKVTGAFRQATRDIDQQIKDLTTLKNHPGLNGLVGPLDSRLPSFLPSTTAAEALYEKIMSRGQFAALQNMRSNSPTGGALGNVSDYEGRTLRNSVAALDRHQGEHSFKEAIDSYINDLQASKSNVEQAYEDTYAYRSNGRAGGGSGQSGAMPSGFRIIGRTPR